VIIIKAGEQIAFSLVDSLMPDPNKAKQAGGQIALPYSIPAIVM
jgi:hypothetical protein